MVHLTNRVINISHINNEVWFVLMLRGLSKGLVKMLYFTSDKSNANKENDRFSS